MQPPFSSLHFPVSIFQSLIVLLCVSPCLARVTISLPDEGAYVPAHLTEVRVQSDGSDKTGELLIYASNSEAVPTRIPLAGNAIDVRVPVLLLGRAIPELRWTYPGGSGATPLRAVDASESTDRFFTDAFAGPTGCVVPAAYEVAEAWRPGLADASRRAILLAGFVVSVALLAAALLRKTWAVAVSAGVVVLTGSILFAIRPEMIREISGEIIIRRGERVQIDTLRLRTLFTRSHALMQLAFAPDVRPLLATSLSGSPAEVTLVCDASGAPLAWEYRLDPARPTAVSIERSISRAAPPATGGSDSSATALAALVRNAYLRPGVRQIFQRENRPDSLGEVRLERDEEPPVRR